MVKPTSSYTPIPSLQKSVSNKTKSINGANSYNNNIPKPHSVLNIDYNADLQSKPKLIQYILFE